MLYSILCRASGSSTDRRHKKTLPPSFTEEDFPRLGKPLSKSSDSDSDDSEDEDNADEQSAYLDDHLESNLVI